MIRILYLPVRKAEILESGLPNGVCDLLTRKLVYQRKANAGTLNTLRQRQTFSNYGSKTSLKALLL